MNTNLIFIVQTTILEGIIRTFEKAKEPLSHTYIYIYIRNEGVKFAARKVGVQPGLEAFPSSATADRDSRDTIFHPVFATANDKRRVSRGFTSSDFLLRNESFSFHSHELSQFPVDSRLLERQIPVGGGRQTRAASALSRICIFIPATWACRLKLVFALERPPRYLQA